MTQTTAPRLRQLASPRRQHPAGRTTRRAAALLLRPACAAPLAWIGYIHLHLWAEGYRQIPTDGPLFLLDAVAGFALAAALLAWPHASGGQRPAPGATGSSKRMESGVGYSCRGPWGGLEISATISPTDLSFASSAISAWDTTPTSRFSLSTTGSRRT